MRRRSLCTLAVVALTTCAALGCESTATTTDGGPDGGSDAPDGGSDAPDGGSDAPDGGSDAPDGGSDAPDGGSDAVPLDGGAPPTGDRFFPDGAWFYQRIDGARATVRPDSTTTTSWLESNGGWGTGQMRIDFSIEVLFADADTPNTSFTATSDFYSPDCDLVPMPVPAGGVLEGETGYECVSDGDCHLIVADLRVNRLFEMWRANITGGTFFGGCLAAWDMTRVYGADGRGEQCTSADAAGFPIAPLLFTADEVAAGRIEHAIRFILPNARMCDGYYVHPATHAGGPSGPAEAPVYGSRWRLRADYPLDTLPSDAARVVAVALQEYGMALADGGNIALTARSDRTTTASWDGLLGSYDLSSLQPSDFEVVDTGAPIELTYDCVRTAY